MVIFYHDKRFLVIKNDYFWVFFDFSGWCRCSEAQPMISSVGGSASSACGLFPIIGKSQTVASGVGKFYRPAGADAKRFAQKGDVFVFESGIDGACVFYRYPQGGSDVGEFLPVFEDDGGFFIADAKGEHALFGEIEFDRQAEDFLIETAAFGKVFGGEEKVVVVHHGFLDWEDE